MGIFYWLEKTLGSYRLSSLFLVMGALRQNLPFFKLQAPSKIELACKIEWLYTLPHRAVILTVTQSRLSEQ